MQATNISTDAGNIRKQLSRLLKSESFQRSAVLSRFLEFVVSETLEGNETTLKEYVIAVHVLNKSSDFNPQLNGIVRIHANRLRKLLDQYYRKQGVNDPMIISIPKGRYIPKFEMKTTKVPVENDGETDVVRQIESKPTVAVLPFESFQEYERLHVVCSVLCHELTAELSKFPEIDVLTNYSTQCALDKTPDIEQIVSNLGIDYLITGHCLREEERTRVYVELNHCQEHKVLWAESFYLEDLETDQVKGYKPLIQKVTAMTGGFFGLIYRNTLNARVPVNYNYLYAIYWHNRYHRKFTEAAFRESLRAIETGLSKAPNNPLLIAFKAELYLNLVVMKTEGQKEYLQKGTELVKQAIALDATCQHAYQVYTWANLLHHDRIEAYRSIDKCLSINPNNPMYIGQMGFGYICIGDYEKGVDLMSESISLNPFYTWNLNIGFCLYFIKNKDYEEALLWAEKVNRSGFLWDPLLRASVLGLLGRNTEALNALEEVRAISPEIRYPADRIVQAFLFDKQLVEKIQRGLQLAGL